VAPGVYAGKTLGQEDWLALRSKVIFDACKWDVQSEDHSVLAGFPLLIESETVEFLQRTAEALSQEALSAEQEIVKQPKLLRRLGLPRKIRRALRECESSGSSPQNLRVMRFDFHFTSQGWRISEVNADVPGGLIEASDWNSLFADALSGVSAPTNTSEMYAQAICDAVGSGGFAALVHATAYSDDRQVMRHLSLYLKKKGIEACLVSPAHIHWVDGSAEIRSAYASGCPRILVRFFPAEWLPNLPNKDSWQPYFSDSKTALSNPGSAIILQTKRFPLVWDELKSDLSTWRTLLPKTREASYIKSMLDDYSILKPALGRVGEGIGMPGITPKDELAKIFWSARQNPMEWVAQERFAAVPIATEKCALYPCLGVFTIGGKAAGFYGRVAERPIIDQNAQDAAVLIIETARGEIQ
jgi:glutathionylspermidine synthase